MNSSYEARGIDCTSVKNGDGFEPIPDYDTFHKLLLNSKGYDGFALPLASGLFKVVRFDPDESEG